MSVRAGEVVPPVVAGLAALAFWRPTLDVFNTTKATVVVLGALALVAWVSAAIARRGTASVPRGPWVWSAAAFAVALVVAVAVSPTPLRSAVGVTGRHGGLIPYAAVTALALAFGSAVARDPVSARRALVRCLAVAGSIAGGYVLVQAAGLDPLAWTTVEGGDPHFGPFGNVDFASAWLGIVAVLLAGGAATGTPSSAPQPSRSAARPEGGPTAEQRLVGVAAVVCVVAALLTGSLQGPVVLAVGLPAVAIVALRPRRRTAAIVTSGLVLLVLLALAGPARGVLTGATRSFETRLPKWQAALTMAAERPIVGLGLDTYGDHWFAARPAAHAEEEGLARTVDNAHDVPLHLLTGGGLLLAGSWLAVVLVIPAWAAWRCWRRRSGKHADLANGPGVSSARHDPAVVGLIAAWVGYLLQSLVSIDVPPLMVLGLLLSAGVAAQGGLLRVDAVAPRPARPAPSNAVRVLAAVVGLAAVVAVVPATRAIRADAVGWQAEVARARAAVLPAEAATLTAMSLAPWESRYPALHGAWLTSMGQAGAALQWQVEALRREPRSLTHALNVARLLTALGDRAGAAQAYGRVLEIDPRTPEVGEEARSLDPPVQGPATGDDPPAIGPPR